MVRDKSGRFVKGHPNVGAGRKSISREQKLLKAVADSVSPEKVAEIMDTLYLRAKKGDIAAIKLYLAYAVGEPVQKAEINGTGAVDILVRYVGKDD